MPRPSAGGTPSASKKPAEICAPSSRSGSVPPPVRLGLARVMAAMPAKERLWARQSTKLGGEEVKRSKPREGLASMSITSRSGLGYGSGSRSTP